jgi:hypothetical protein
MMTLTGRLQGNLITLEEKPAQLEGRLLRIVVEPIEDSELELSAEEQRAALNAWIEHGPQGPLPDDDYDPFDQ